VAEAIVEVAGRDLGLPEHRQGKDLEVVIAAGVPELECRARIGERGHSERTTSPLDRHPALTRAVRSALERAFGAREPTVRERRLPRDQILVGDPNGKPCGAVASTGLAEGEARLLAQVDAALHVAEEPEREPVSLECVGASVALHEPLEP
jgi:hypothetical protein